MEYLNQFQILFNKARTDLRASKNLLEDIENGDEELDLEIIMFHLQQSAEKLLKALLAYNEYHFTKTHNLKELIAAIKENNIPIIENIDELVILSYYAIEGRYAIIHDDLADSDKYIKILDSLLEFVANEIK